MRPPFKYWGSKTSMAPWIIERLPPHEHFVEVCAGSAAVLLAKPPTVLETVNDLYGEIVNFFSVIRNPEMRECLIEFVAFTPYSREEFRKSLVSDWTNPVQRALDFLVRMNQAVVPGRTGWSYTSSPKSARGQRTTRWASLPDELAKVGLRMERVQVECLDMVDCIQRYDKPGVVLLVDPPYMDESRPTSTGASSGYAVEASAGDHDRLLACLRSVKDAAVAVTHYPHPAYDDLDWKVHDYTSYRNVANQASAGDRSEAVERLYLRMP